MNEPDLITPAEAARRLAVTRVAVYGAIKAGRLARYERYGHVLVDAAEVAQYKPNAHKERRPRWRCGPQPELLTEETPAYKAD